MAKQIKITSLEKRKYVLAKDIDYEILMKCKELEKLKLSKEDRFLVQFIKTQLEQDWRKPLSIALNKLLKKYKGR